MRINQNYAVEMLGESLRALKDVSSGAINFILGYLEGSATLEIFFGKELSWFFRVDDNTLKRCVVSCGKSTGFKRFSNEVAVEVLRVFKKYRFQFCTYNCVFDNYYVTLEDGSCSEKLYILGTNDLTSCLDRIWKGLGTYFKHTEGLESYGIEDVDNGICRVYRVFKGGSEADLILHDDYSTTIEGSEGSLATDVNVQEIIAMVNTVANVWCDISCINVDMNSNIITVFRENGSVSIGLVGGSKITGSYLQEGKIIGAE